MSEVITQGESRDFSDWAERGRQLCETGKRLHWQIGDWWRTGQHKYGDRAKVAAENIFGLEYPTLRRLSTVADAFEIDRRRSLPFSHHAEVAAIPADKADELLDNAEAEGWSVRQLRAEVSRIKNAADDSRADHKLLTVFYVGDFDPSGMHMSEVDVPARLERYGGVVYMERIALTADDVAPGTKIPGFDAATKVGDARHKWFTQKYGNRCWELDAMSPVELRERVRDAIVGMLDLPRWHRAIEVEKAERESMTEFMKSWKGVFRGRPENTQEVTE